MTTTAVPTPFSIVYVECDLREGQTLVEWRGERDASRRQARRSRRPRLMHLFPRPRPAG